MSKEDAPYFRLLTITDYACDNCKHSIVNEWHGLFCQRYEFQSVLDDYCVCDDWESETLLVIPE